MKSLDYTKIASFLFLSIAFSVLGLYLPGWMGMDTSPESIFGQLLQILLYGWGPGLAVMVMTNVWGRGSLAAYGWSRKKLTFRWLLTSIAAPYGVGLAVLGLVFLLGNVIGLPGFGKVIMFDPAGLYDLSPYFATFFGYSNPGLMMPDELKTAIVLIFIISLIAGPTISLLFNLGEELGFRGFLVRETQALGFMGSNLIVGLIQGIWTLPLFIYAMPDLGAISLNLVLVTFGYFVALAFPMAYFSLKSGSIYSSAIFVSVFSFVNTLSVFFIWGEDPYLAGPKGLIGILVLLAITFFIIRWDSQFVENYADLRFVEEEKEIPISDEDEELENGEGEDQA
jgi:membrane protease YdiL (CAAX protease family)